MRVLVLWRHRILGEALAGALDERSEVSVVAATGSRREAEQVLRRSPVDTVVLDSAADPAWAEELVFRLKESPRRPRVLAFGLASEEQAVSLIEAGADGWLAREATLDEVVACLTGERPDGHPFPLSLAGRLAARIDELASRAPRSPGPGANGHRAAGVAALSNREAEVLVLVARGLGNKEIAHELGIRTATVKNHVHAILSKLGVGHRRDAVRTGYELGLLQGPFEWRPIDDGEVEPR